MDLLGPVVAARCGHGGRPCLASPPSREKCGKRAVSTGAAQLFLAARSSSCVDSIWSVFHYGRTNTLGSRQLDRRVAGQERLVDTPCMDILGVVFHWIGDFVSVVA